MSLSHNSRVDLFEIKNNGLDLRRRESLKNMDVDPKDGDQCRELLRRLAKQYRLDPHNTELLVWEGSKREKFRL